MVMGENLTLINNNNNKKSMKKQLLMKTFLVAVCLLGGANFAWADALETVGDVGNTSEWWTVFSTGNYKVAKETGRHIRFTNYNSGGENWHNWVVGINSQQDRGGTEFAIIRSDHYGWDSYIMNYYCNYNWDDYKNKMNGATVDMYIYYKGTNVFINNVITTNEATPKTWNYNISLYNISGDYVYPFFVADHSHIEITLSEVVEIPNTIPDYSTIGCKDWQVWTEARNHRVLNSGQSYHFRFKNYYIGSNNWENFLIKGYQLTKNATTEVYDVNTAKFAMRADHYDDVTSGQCTNNFGGANLADVYKDGATIDAVVTYNTNNTATIRADITTADGKSKYYEEETVTLEAEGLPLYIYPAVNGAYLEMMQESYVEVATIGATGWATFSSDYALDFSKATTGLEAYMITGHEGSVVTKSQVTGTVPAGTGLLLKGAEGSYTIPVVGSSSTDVSANKLVAGTGASVSKEDGKTKYVLGVSASSEAEFQKIDGTAATVAKGKAYLQFNEVISARSMSFEGDEITGIENVAAPAEATLKEGKFIENGQLVIVKNGVKVNAAGQQMK